MTGTYLRFNLGNTTRVYLSIVGVKVFLRQTEWVFSFARSVMTRIATFGSHLFVQIAFVAGTLGSPAVWAATSANAQSPMGVNLEQVSYYTAEQPFLDIVKTSPPWTTQDSSQHDTGEENILKVDANGWPTSLAGGKFTQVSVLVLRSLPNTSNGNYPAGQYVVRYQGEGTIAYNYDAVKVPSLSSAGRDIINVANPSAAGVLITITSTDPNHTGNYIRNIQLVKAEQESALLSGQVFNPAFLKMIQNFRALRFMDWFNTNGSKLSTWNQRPLPTYFTWATAAGVPYEIAVQAANAVSADAWLNVPIMATDDYISKMATLVHQQLGTSQKAYVELSNEVWNGGFPQFAYANAQGRATWPSAGSSADYGNNWYGMRVAQTCDMWKAAWGADASRVVCVMGAQAANPWTATEAMACTLWSGAPCANHGISAVAIAPYFGSSVPSSWASQGDGGLGSLFASLTSQNDASVPKGGWVGQALGWVAAYAPVIAKYKVSLISYEGGQAFVGTGALGTLYYHANRDARMQAAYQAYLQGWKQNGGQLFMQYNDVFPNSPFGEWGALESVMQTITPLSSAPPKWQALQNYISANPCWWAGCSGATGAQIPMAPSNLTIH